ncbi:uncharacterized protein LOC132567298 [Heteronotia binoei]|uniref:uncharacterized protein LOC132567298 n=1 Tax=Heteronotia binoei TaxID=13085 RepID=UPI00292F181E|nr:uncharacterized protein LOC132567298 [Heteronotia binoei]
MPKSIKSVNELLKGREAHHFAGSLNNDAGKTQMLKTIQNVKRLAIAKIVILPTTMTFSPGDDTVHLSLPVEIGIEAISKTGIFSSLAKVKIDIVAKLLWKASKDQVFIIEASKIFINDIQVKEKQRVTGPDEKHVRSIVWTILNDVINQCIRLVADILNSSLLSTLVAAVPVGTFGNIQYNLIGCPKVTDRYFLIPYQASIILGFGF